MCENSRQIRCTFFDIIYVISKISLFVSYLDIISVWNKHIMCQHVFATFAKQKWYARTKQPNQASVTNSVSQTPLALPKHKTQKLQNSLHDELHKKCGRENDA